MLLAMESRGFKHETGTTRSPPKKAKEAPVTRSKSLFTNLKGSEESVKAASEAGTNSSMSVPKRNENISHKHLHKMHQSEQPKSGHHANVY